MSGNSQVAPLAPWMTWLLRFTACYNLLAGAQMFFFYHEAFKVMGIAKPEVNLPIQLVGVLVALFGVGYWMVARDPLLNRNVLLLGFLSKAMGATLGVYYVVVLKKLPVSFLGLLFVSDIVYLPPFWVILKRLWAAADRAG